MEQNGEAFVSQEMLQITVTIPSDAISPAVLNKRLVDTFHPYSMPKFDPKIKLGKKKINDLTKLLPCQTVWTQDVCVQQHNGKINATVVIPPERRTELYDFFDLLGTEYAFTFKRPE